MAEKDRRQKEDVNKNRGIIFALEAIVPLIPQTRIFLNTPLTIEKSDALFKSGLLEGARAGVLFTLIVAPFVEPNFRTFLEATGYQNSVVTLGILCYSVIGFFSARYAENKIDQLSLHR